jgi:hypothetical protein
MLIALTTTHSLDTLLDLEEIDNVSRSWRDAVQANGEDAAARAPAPRRGRRGAAR